MEEKPEVEYFWDSYAIIEILKENQSYKKYKNNPVTITIFNLVEIYYSCLDNFNEEELTEIYDKYKGAVVEIPDEILKKAIKFRKKYKSKDLSYADCIGYTYAVENDMKFLTGDKEFKDLEGVEFVK